MVTGCRLSNGANSDRVPHTSKLASSGKTQSGVKAVRLHASLHTHTTNTSSDVYFDFICIDTHRFSFHSKPFPNPHGHELSHSHNYLVGKHAVKVVLLFISIQAYGG